MDANDIKRRKDFFEQLNLSEAATRNYRNALNSSFLKGKIYAEYNKISLFEITDLETLWDLYTKNNWSEDETDKRRV